jgi:hypothetical protein
MNEAGLARLFTVHHDAPPGAVAVMSAGGAGQFGSGDGAAAPRTSDVAAAKTMFIITSSEYGVRDPYCW